MASGSDADAGLRLGLSIIPYGRVGTFDAADCDLKTLSHADPLQVDNSSHYCSAHSRLVSASR